MCISLQIIHLTGRFIFVGYLSYVYHIYRPLEFYSLDLYQFKANSLSTLLTPLHAAAVHIDQLTVVAFFILLI